MVRLTIEQIERNIDNWFKILGYKTHTLVFDGYIALQKQNALSFDINCPVKNNSRFIIYFCTNIYDENYVHIVVDDDGYEKNAYALAYHLARIFIKHIDTLHTITNKYDEIVDLLNIITGSTVKAKRRRVHGGMVYTDDNNDVESNVDTIQTFHRIDKLVRQRIIISPTFVLNVQTNIKLINDMNSVFTYEDPEIGITNDVPNVNLLPLPVIHPMCGGRMENGFTFDYRLIRQELSNTESYNKKDFAIVFDDDVMVRCLLGLPGDVLVCKRVIFDESPYDEYVIKRIVSRIADDETNV
jgi:hypothetical protein